MVVSPFRPYNIIDVTGYSRGDIVGDPSTALINSEDRISVIQRRRKPFAFHKFAFRKLTFMESLFPDSSDSEVTLSEPSDSVSDAPLAARMRPTALTEVVGQQHILAEGNLLRRAIEADRFSSLIFYGPPGTGKTTLATVIANSTDSRFEMLNGVESNVAEIRDKISQAQKWRQLREQTTILFIDEIHRFNKAQQDVLLPHVERGTIRFIGATTHNPYFYVNSPLVSRSQIFQLEPISSHDLITSNERCSH